MISPSPWRFARGPCSFRPAQSPPKEPWPTSSPVLSGTLPWSGVSGGVSRLLLLRGLSRFPAVFGPSLLLGGRDAPPGSRAQYSLGAGLRRHAVRGQHDSFPSKLTLDLPDFIFYLLLFYLITYQRHL